MFLPDPSGHRDVALGLVHERRARAARAERPIGAGHGRALLGPAGGNGRTRRVGARRARPRMAGGGRLGPRRRRPRARRRRRQAHVAGRAAPLHVEDVRPLGRGAGLRRAERTGPRDREDRIRPGRRRSDAAVGALSRSAPRVPRRSGAATRGRLDGSSRRRRRIKRRFRPRRATCSCSRRPPRWATRALVASAVGAALEAGVAVATLEEVLLQIVPYAGFPRASRRSRRRDRRSGAPTGAVPESDADGATRPRSARVRPGLRRLDRTRREGARRAPPPAPGVDEGVRVRSRALACARSTCRRANCSPSRSWPHSVARTTRSSATCARRCGSGRRSTRSRARSRWCLRAPAPVDAPPRGNCSRARARRRRSTHSRGTGPRSAPFERNVPVAADEGGPDASRRRRATMEGHATRPGRVRGHDLDPLVTRSVRSGARGARRAPTHRQRAGVSVTSVAKSNEIIAPDEPPSIGSTCALSNFFC